MNVWEILGGAVGILAAIAAALGWYRVQVQAAVARERDLSHLIRNHEATNRALSDWKTEDEAKHSEVMRMLSSVDNKLNTILIVQDKLACIAPFRKAE